MPPCQITSELLYCLELQGKKPRFWSHFELSGFLYHTHPPSSINKRSKTIVYAHKPNLICSSLFCCPWAAGNFATFSTPTFCGGATEQCRDTVEHCCTTVLYPMMSRPCCNSEAETWHSHMPNFTLLVQRVALVGKNPQNRPLSKLNASICRACIHPAGN